MPTIEENRMYWDEKYDWARAGNEWSRAWGGPDMQWFGAILPRIHRYLPAHTILEIAPGFGRWTHFIKDYCERLILVDLSERCIQACRERFASLHHLSYYVNDGRSLDFLSAESVDVVLSFDSLVHVEADVMAAYLGQLVRPLRHDGVGILHHSNLGEYPPRVPWLARIPKARRGLEKLRMLETDHWRATSMTAQRFRQFAQQAGLQCISQELINWGGRRLIDCISVFTTKSSGWAGSPQVVRNPNFMREAEQLRILSRLYGAST
jgi:SAM-dependent methyltransferase